MDRTSRIDQLLGVLEEQPGSTLSELSEAAELPKRQTAMLLWRLEEEARVVHEAHRWFPAP